MFSSTFRYGLLDSRGLRVFFLLSITFVTLSQHCFRFRSDEQNEQKMKSRHLSAKDKSRFEVVVFSVHAFPFGCFSTFPIWPDCHCNHSLWFKQSWLCLHRRHCENVLKTMPSVCHQSNDELYFRLSFGNYPLTWVEWRWLIRFQNWKENFLK